MSDLVKDLREHHWCENEEWTCNNCKAADEIEQLRADKSEAIQAFAAQVRDSEQKAKRIADLESLAHDAEDILSHIDGDDDPLDISDWRRWYRELGLVPTGDSDDGN